MRTQIFKKFLYLKHLLENGYTNKIRSQLGNEIINQSRDSDEDINGFAGIKSRKYDNFRFK